MLFSESEQDAFSKATNAPKVDHIADALAKQRPPGSRDGQNTVLIFKYCLVFQLLFFSIKCSLFRESLSLFFFLSNFFPAVPVGRLEPITDSSLLSSMMSRLTTLERQLQQANQELAEKVVTVVCVFGMRTRLCACVSSQ